jgi:hypothetical protein
MEEVEDVEVIVLKAAVIVSRGRKRRSLGSSSKVI